jgi:hypothetical protein
MLQLMVSFKTKLELRSERDSDQKETGARSWDAQWRNGKEYCAMRSSLMLARLRKPLRRSKRRRVGFGTAHLSTI